MRIDSRSSLPVYRQIIQGMQSAIAAGVYRPGESIPSTRALAIQLTVNPNTVQKAYEALVDLGVLESRRGKGKIVSDRGGQSALQQSEKSVQQTIQRGIQLARSAGLSDQRIRQLLNETLKINSKKVRA